MHTQRGHQHHCEECQRGPNHREFHNNDVAKRRRVIGNGRCDGGDYNTEECGYDGGDCTQFNQKYPNCTALYPFHIGDGRCDDSDYYGYYNTSECGYDGGDCLD